MLYTIKREEATMHDFLCPKCDGNIRVGDNVIFKVKNQKKQAGLFLLSPHIGNYTSVKHPKFEIVKDEYLEFFCPLCNGSLESDIHKNLAHVILCDESGKCNDVYFSQVVGEHSTFKTDGDSVHIAGEDAGRYTYFKIGDKFKKYF
ncbi:MAG: hypothetical protein HZB98_09955 [Bacteroidia bacterium]|nr:hypothetical protein [Bacteroidia bacterium]